ncbi:MAG: HAMP domain-containing protein [Nitrospirae bacterium]|nr:HAMP domain-containing protein [Nitrospirota bacterium]
MGRTTFPRFSLSTKLSGAFASLALASMLVVFFYGARTIDELGQAWMKEHLTGVSTHVHDILDESRTRVRNTARILVRDDALRYAAFYGAVAGERGLLREETRALAGLLNLDLLEIHDLKGRVLARAEEEDRWGDRRDLPFLKKTAAKEPSFGLVDLDGSAILLAAAPLENEGRRFGTLAAGLRIDSTLARKISQRSGAQVLFVVGNRIAGSSLDHPQRDILGGVTPGGGDPRLVAAGGKTYLAFARSLDVGQHDEKSWIVLAVDATPFKEAVSRMRALLFLATVLLLVLAVTAGTALALRVTRPLKQAIRLAGRIAEGDLQKRIDVSGHDEVAELGAALNQMSARLLDSRNEIEKKQSELLKLNQSLGETVEKLRELQEHLVEAERRAASGTLAARVAHEINNPLGIIKNYLTMLKSHCSAIQASAQETPAHVRHLQIIDEEIDRIARFVAQLLDAHRPDGSRLELTSVNKTVTDLLALMEPQLRQRDIQVRRELDPDLPRLLLHPDRMKQVLLNLMANAEHAMPDGGVMTIRTRREESDVFVEVSDTGKGISHERAPQIFDRYYTTREDGTGLGLPISREIVQGYGGDITVRSVEGEGAAFTVRLPRSPLVSTATAVPGREAVDDGP